MKKNKFKFIFIVLILILIVFLLRILGVAHYIKLENITELKSIVNSFGWWAPVFYIISYILAIIFFMPGLPITLLSGIVFGPIWGTVWASIASIGGATASFLVARYAARDLIEAKFKGNKQYQKIDQGVKKQGWRILVLTRMVPIFPFNLQNYLYGLTDISLVTYVLVSWITMLPATIAYCFAAGSIVSGGSLKKTFFYLAIAAIFFILLSFIPKFLKRNSEIIED